MRARPCRPAQQFLLGQAWRWQPIPHDPRHLGQYPVDVVRRVGVGPNVGCLNPADQSGLRINDRDLRSFGRQLRGNRLAQCGQRGRLATALASDHQQVRHPTGPKCHRLQCALADRERNVQRIGIRIGGAMAPQDVIERDSLRKPRQGLESAHPGPDADHGTDLTGSDPLAVGPECLRQADQQFVSCVRNAEPWPVESLPSRAPMLYPGTHLRLIGIAQAQLDARVSHVEQCLFLADQPSACAGHNMDTVGEALARDGNCAVTERTVLIVEISEVVNHQENVAEFILRVGYVALRTESTITKLGDVQPVALER